MPFDWAVEVGNQGIQGKFKKNVERDWEKRVRRGLWFLNEVCFQCKYYTICTIPSKVFKFKQSKQMTKLTDLLHPQWRKQKACMKDKSNSSDHSKVKYDRGETLSIIFLTTPNIYMIIVQQLL